MRGRLAERGQQRLQKGRVASVEDLSCKHGARTHLTGRRLC